MGRAEARYRIGLPALGVMLVLLGASAVYAANDFRLKAGARGKLCVDCHDAFEKILKKPFVHTPLAEEECIGCHNPHTSDHGKLLGADSGDICNDCHDDVLSPGARSTHQVVADGECDACHDPHAADNEMNLIRPGSELCFECHEEMGEKIASDEFEHEPVKEDCLECHNAHASAENPKLLKAAQPALCLDCHETDTSSFRRVHENYPVERARCTFCHDPHGSNNEAILYDIVHEPVADGECEECHVAASSAKPFALKNSGYELCEGCHYDMIIEALNKRRVHWPLLDKRGCINCHTPHASAEEGLIEDSMLIVCGRCHTDTVARQERSETEHPPVAEGECTECHSPHGSDELFIISEPSYIELCEGCHEWQAHSTHPIGEKIVDPRNGNITVQCLSCHRTHGTEYKHFIYYETTNEMCVQCHEDYRR